MIRAFSSGVVVAALCFFCAALASCRAHFNDSLAERSGLDRLRGYELHMLSRRVPRIEEYREVIADENHWQRRWVDRPAPGIDFTRNVVLAVAQGSSAQDQSPRIMRLEERPDELRVLVQVLPMFQEERPFGYFQHYHFVAVPRPEKPVRFVDVRAHYARNGTLESVVEDRVYPPIAPPSR